MAESVVTTVALHVHPDVAVPNDGPCIVITREIDRDPQSPAVRWDVSTDLALGPDVRAAYQALGEELHALAHLMLSQSGAMLDLTAPAPGGAS